MIVFHKLRWKNFLSTGNYFSEIELNKTQNTLIVGENGSGKSTMLDALCFVLYNRPFRNINKPALCNSINQKDTIVEVIFNTDNHEFKIIRGIKPSVFEIYRDGILINQNAESKDYQEHLEKFILKLNYKSFTQIVILGSASFTPFMQLSSADRRSIIEDLLDIQIFSTMNSLVKSRQSELQTKRNENKMLVESTLEKISMQKRYMQEAQEGVEKLILEYKEEIHRHKEDISKSSSLRAACLLQISNLQDEIKDKDKLEKTIKKATQLEAQIEQNLSKQKKTKGFYETETTCPTCIQTIEEEFKKKQLCNIGDKVKEYEEGLSILREKFKIYQERITAIQEVEKQIANYSVKLAEYTTSTTQINKFIKTLEEKIQAASVDHISVERERDRLEDHQKELNQLENNIKEIVETISYYEAAGLLLKDTGIKTKIIRQYLPIINMVANKYLSSMDFFVNFNLDESFKETIKSRYRDDFSYASFSEGEKQRIDMSLMLTWRTVAKLKNSASTNLLILDEVFDSSMDVGGTEELMKILHHLEGENVFVISHRGDILQDKFSNVIRFSKQQNFSHITQ